MTIILFLVDTSASMNQRAYLGGRPSLLDVAKGAVETFVKIRQRSPDSRGDRYMLLTCEEPPYNIKAAWKESLSTFMAELKNLQATGLTTLGAALKATFDLLNINRMQTGIDMYGQGRYPFYLEPAFIVAITDGGRISHNGGVHEELHLPMSPNIPGAELTREPFRWDQRLFSLVLRLTGTPPLERDLMGLVPRDGSPIDTMCEVTGGRSYAISSHRMLMQCVESLVQKIQSGVVIHFEKIGPDPPMLAAEAKTDGVNEDVVVDGGDDGKLSSTNNGWQFCRKMIHVPRSAQKGFAVGFWPIPEAFWPDANAPSLPPRTAHPVVKFTCTNQEPMIIENLPFDKYELEPCPLTRFILHRKQANTCWQVFVSNSYKSNEAGHAFGYLKASTNLQSVNLFVMPYNYPVLLPLLDELFKIHRLKPSADWRSQFANYLRTMPPYYAAPLRRALNRMGASTIASQLVSESLDNSLSYSVVNYLKRLKNQAKVEFDRACSEVGRHRPVATESVKVTARSTLRKDLVSNPNLTAKFAHLRDQLNDFTGFTVALKEREVRPQSLRNPFDVPRSALLDQVARMRANFLQPSLNHTKLHDDDHIHSMPVSQMGNYQEYLKRIPPPLREIESTPVRQHMFGNPFKIDKRMMVDEADIDLVGGSGGQGSNRGLKRAAEAPLMGQTPSKRKRGPLSRDVAIRRSPSPIPRPASPAGTPLYFPPPSPPSLSLPGPGPVVKTETASPLTLRLAPELASGEIGTIHVKEELCLTPASPAPLLNGKTTDSGSLVQSEPSRLRIAVDETDIDRFGGQGSNHGLKRTSETLPVNQSPSKCKPGPSAHDVTTQRSPSLVPRPSSPVGTPPYFPPPSLPSFSLPEPVLTTEAAPESMSKEVETVPVKEKPYLTPPSPAPLLNGKSTDVGSSVKSEPTRVLPISVAEFETPTEATASGIPLKLANGTVEVKGSFDLSSHVYSAVANGINHPPERKQHTNHVPLMTKEELEHVRKHNLQIRSNAFVLVKRPGKNYGNLLAELSRLQGSAEVRGAVVKDVASECLRFKRRVLADLVTKLLQKTEDPGS